MPFMKRIHLSKFFLGLLGLLVLSAFTADQAQEKTVTSPKNIIIMVANGMGVGQLTAARLANDNRLNLDQFPQMALLSTASANTLNSDRAAAATALACGVTTTNGSVGMNAEGVSVPNLFEWAKGRNMQTALITMGSLTDPSLSAYYAHQKEGNNTETNAQLLVDAYIDVFIGGGLQYFTSRTDNVNLATSLKQKGYKVYKDIKKPSKIKGQKVAVISEKNFIAPKSGGRDAFFSESWEATKNVLPLSGPYLTIITDPHVEDACTNKNLQQLTDELLDFDKVVGDVMEHARMMGNTLVIVLGDREVGGLSLSENGKGKLSTKWTGEGATANMVPLFAYGVGAEAFAGQYATADVYHKLLELVK